MNKKITVNLAVAIAILAMTVTFVVTMILSTQIFNSTVSSVRQKQVMYNNIAEIDKAVRASYYGEINDTTLYDMMGAGYMAGIGDPNAVYYTAAQYTEYKGIQSGKVVGVGVDVVKDATTNNARVVRVYNDSPAQQAGFEKNWMITKIGETDVKNLTLAQINSLLRGEAGTTVTITATNLAGETKTAELQRRQYDMPSIEYTVPAGKTTGYVRIYTFNANTEKEMEAALEDMTGRETPIDSLVLDVRDNDGGSLTEAMDVIDMLCPVGTIASQEKGGEVTVLDTSDNKEVQLPIVVLMNKSTAAGAELLADSIRIFEKGSLVGITTAGKGSITCEPVAMTNGSAVSFTIGKLLDHNGESFDGTGVSPDVEVPLTAEEERNYYNYTVDTDPQIAKAFETASLLLNRQQNQAASSGAASTSESEAGTASQAQPSSDSAAQPSSDSTAQ